MLPQIGQALGRAAADVGAGFVHGWTGYHPRIGSRAVRKPAAGAVEATPPEASPERRQASEAPPEASGGPSITEPTVGIAGGVRPDRLSAFGLSASEPATAGFKAVPNRAMSPARTAPLPMAQGDKQPVTISAPLPLMRSTASSAGRASAWTVGGPQPLSSNTLGSTFTPWTPPN